MAMSDSLECVACLGTFVVRLANSREPRGAIGAATQVQPLLRGRIVSHRSAKAIGGTLLAINERIQT